MLCVCVVDVMDVAFSLVIRCRFGDLIIHCRQPGRGGILLA